MTTHSAFCFCASCLGGDAGAAAAQRARDATLDRNEWEEDQEILQQTRATASNQSEENDTMKAPAPSGGQGGGKSLATAPAPTTSGGGGSSYLKAEHIAQRGTTALTFLGGAKASTGQYGAGVDLPVSVGKKKYTFTVKFESGNYPRLYARFGSNFAKWKGKVKCCVAQHLGKNYVQIVD